MKYISPIIFVALISFYQPSCAQSLMIETDSYDWSDDIPLDEQDEFSLIYQFANRETGATENLKYEQSQIRLTCINRSSTHFVECSAKNITAKCDKEEYVVRKRIPINVVQPGDRFEGFPYTVCGMGRGQFISLKAEIEIKIVHTLK